MYNYAQYLLFVVLNNPAQYCPNTKKMIFKVSLIHKIMLFFTRRRSANV